MRDFRFLVLTPPGLLDPALAIAASRAGELGILDLEYASNQEAARWSAVQLTQHARGEYGLKLSCQQGELLSELIAWAPESLSLVWLTGRDPQALRQQVAVMGQ
jgi:hypothetical protein